MKIHCQFTLTEIDLRLLPFRIVHKGVNNEIRHRLKSILKPPIRSPCMILHAPLCSPHTGPLGTEHWTQCTEPMCRVIAHRTLADMGATTDHRIQTGQETADNNTRMKKMNRILLISTLLTTIAVNFSGQCTVLYHFSQRPLTSIWHGTWRTSQLQHALLIDNR